MSNFWDAFFYSEKGKTKESNVIIAKDVRISVLTPYLLRIETQTEGKFCDAPTQSIMDRQFDCPKFSVAKEGHLYKIRTEKCSFCYDIQAKKMLYIVLDDTRRITDYDTGNLKGTCRTLDGTNGKTAVSDGILSKNGVAVLDDSASLLVCNNGEILPRPAKESDKYYFAYGSHYQTALSDYFRLTGMPPLIPRFTLGNWWSRYKAYTQQEYIDLMEKFKAKKIPLTVATIDMDWHWVDVIEKFGEDARDQKKKKGVLELFYNLMNPGWTGYSWNTDLFPTPAEFLQYLKANDLKITMNLHPASGCKFYEDAYVSFCDFMGIDPSTREQIKFDIADRKFMEGYFTFLHHPHEAQGVDFWWIDWQQGTKSRIPGLDPLWALNHYHYMDNRRNGTRPLILSRFAGAGSHRYPLGFSGDSAQTWATLNFQPYFTATASNIGYTWWSHDIGGHHLGERDDELYLRWVQYGVFSPIMRLHSTSNEFMGKEPWKYRADVEYFATQALRLRHRLIPYIYTMNYLTHTKGQPLIRPMYYLHPEDERAYQVPNEYYFGTELIACPITEKTSAKTGLAGTKVFLPEGRYTDIFTGRIYNGNREVTLYRDTSSFPVLAKEGAIIPFGVNDKDNRCDNPDTLRLSIYRGCGSFSLYEDDGVSEDYKDGKSAFTDFSVEEKDNTLCFFISPVKGDCSLLPSERTYILSFEDIEDAQKITVKKNGEDSNEFSTEKDGHIEIRFNDVTPADSIEVILSHVTVRRNQSLREYKIELLSKLQGSNTAKKRYERLLETDKNTTAPSELKGAFEELDALWY